MILHLARDGKFVDDGYDQFELCQPGNNKLMIITEAKELIYIKTKKAHKISDRELLSSQFVVE